MNILTSHDLSGILKRRGFITESFFKTVTLHKIAQAEAVGPHHDNPQTQTI